MSNSKSADNLKSIGGQVSPELYWAFKEAQGKRHETATAALEHAIRLYIDLEENSEE